MENINSLEQLMIFYLQGIIDTEQSFLNDLEREVYFQSSEGLKTRLLECERLCRRHIDELRAILDDLSADSSTWGTSFGIDGIILDFNELLGRIEDNEIANAAILVFIQTVCHCKITAYGTVSSFARLLGREPLSARLHHILAEEKELDESLTKLAESSINVHAISPQVPPHREN